MEERLARLEEGQKRIEKRLENFEAEVKEGFSEVQKGFDILCREIKTMNNTMQAIFNVGFESYKNVFLQRDAVAIIAKAYEEAYKKLNREVV